MLTADNVKFVGEPVTADDGNLMLVFFAQYPNGNVADGGKVTDAIEDNSGQLSTAVSCCRHSIGVAIIIINPRHACAAMVAVVVLCVCLSAAHAILAVHAIKSIMKDTIVLGIRFAAIIKWHISLNCLIRKLYIFYLPRQGRPFS